MACDGVVASFRPKYLPSNALQFVQFREKAFAPFRLNVEFLPKTVGEPTTS
jgi:hypothetical protein